MRIIEEGKPEIISERELENDIKALISICGQVRKPRGNKGTKKKVYYRNIICAFDIETSKIVHNDELHSIMYLWQFAITDSVKHRIIVYMGRVWDTFNIIIDTINNNTMKDDYVVAYVHNLSYELQFLSGLYNFENDNVFCIKSHKILKAVYGHVEFRCSMIHSNMSLDKWTHNLNVEHGKMSGDDFDYSITRYPWTQLTFKELSYGYNDVVGLIECINTELERDNDSLYTIPLTSTGYVRRNVKNAMREIAHQLVQVQLYLKEDVYILLNEAFRGGDVHANRYFTNRILYNVNSLDICSSYPNQILNGLFPMTQFRRNPFIKTMDDIIEDISIKERACIARIAIYGYCQYDRYNGFPYLSFSKCRHVINPLFDNGRILSADYLETTVTDIDLKIIIKEMGDDGFIIPLEYYSARYGSLPEVLKNEVRTYYKNKTELKGIESEEYYYNKAKNLLNSIFGLSVQNPCKQNILYDDGEYNESDIPISTLLEKYNKRSFMAFQWGIWITANSRMHLRKALWKVGRFATYCDTDSVKYIGNVDFSDINREYIELSKLNGAYAEDRKGNTHYMGVFENDGHYDKFATLGAKKYVYETNGSLHITIAGVNKVKGAKELAMNGGIERFLLKKKTRDYIGVTEIDTEGFIFRDGGGNELIYNDEKSYGYYSIDNNSIEVTRNVVIKESTYQLGVSADYKRVLENVEYLTEFQ